METVRERKNMKKIISIDVESDGLWGNPFAIGAICYDKDGNEVDKITLRLPDEIVTNEWVKDNVLPTLDFPISHIYSTEKTFINMTPIWVQEPEEKVYERFLKDFSEFYLKYSKEGYEALWHMGHIVEANLFKEMHRLSIIGDWDAPYVPIEVSAYLEQVGEKPDSVDSYVKKYNIKVNDYGTTHNPLYDCEVAYKTYKDIISRK